MIRLLWAASTNIHYFTRRYLPSNILIDTICTRRGLKWGVPAMLLAVPYLLVTDVCVRLIADGGPGWLHLVVLVCIWNALKMLWIGPISVVLLIRARLHEAAVARQRRRVTDDARRSTTSVEAISEGHMLRDGVSTAGAGRS